MLGDGKKAGKREASGKKDRETTGTRVPSATAAPEKKDRVPARHF